jgi:hypothetical protein
LVRVADNLLRLGGLRRMRPGFLSGYTALLMAMYAGRTSSVCVRTSLQAQHAKQIVSAARSHTIHCIYLRRRHAARCCLA